MFIVIFVSAAVFSCQILSKNGLGAAIAGGLEDRPANIMPASANTAAKPNTILVIPFIFVIHVSGYQHAYYVGSAAYTNYVQT